jgi:bacterioferritin-associated ferredoxin
VEPAPVDRCVCREVTFAELIRIHAQTGAGFEEFQRRTGCGTVCGLCTPYIRAALRTGRARLPVLSDEALDRLAPE